MSKIIKIIIASALTIVLCLGITVGATYALFTHEDNVNIAVTSGHLAVTANLALVEQYSPDNDGGLKSGWLSGRASENGGSIILDNMAPADGVKFKIVIANDSSVAIKWQVVVTFSGDSELYDKLVITLGDDELVDTGEALVSNWNTLELGGDQTVTLDECRIELGDMPIGLQTSTCAVTVTVYAVQASAITTNPTPNASRA